MIVSVPEELRYSEEHEWVSGLGGEDGIVTVGITAHAADALGEIVYIELQPSEGDAVEAGEPCGEVESTKSVSDLYSPVSGEIKVRISEEPGDLLDSAAYDKLIEEA
ncbi:glycine cleavage system protein GcvH [Actinomadura luteofluorescens]